MISLFFIAPRKPFFWASSSLSPPLNMIPKYIPLNNYPWQARVQLALRVVPPRAGRTVISSALHSSGAIQTICLDTSPLAHFFGAGQVFCPASNHLDLSFNAGWIAHLDSSPIVAYSSILGREETGLLAWYYLPDCKTSEALALMMKPPYTTFQAMALAKASRMSSG